MRRFRVVRLVTDLTVAYGDRPVLWDIDLDVPAGKLMAIMGPNGAGKTTLIKAILGLVPTAAGRVQIHGSDTPGIEHVRPRVGQRVDDLRLARGVGVNTVRLHQLRDAVRRQMRRNWRAGLQ